MAFDIRTRIEEWRAHLVDTSKRNRLIHFTAGRTGGLWLLHPEPAKMWDRLIVREETLTFVWKRDLLGLPRACEKEREPSTAADWLATEDAAGNGESVSLEQCLQCPRLKDSHLLTELSDGQLGARLRYVHMRARESLSEQGIVTLYVAFGFLHWYESTDSREELCSPLLLIPAQLKREHVAAPWKLAVEEGEVLVNHSLAERLKHDFKIELPALAEETFDREDPAWRTEYYRRVQERIQGEARWQVQDRVALGIFNFQKLVMWDDLGRNAARIAAHDLCRAIAGDPTVTLTCPADLPRAAELDDKIQPAEAFHVLDADSSQLEAIAAALRGAHVVLDGPPGLPAQAKAKPSPTSLPNSWPPARQYCSSAKKRPLWRWSRSGSIVANSATSAWTCTATKPTSAR
ncbi:MAG: hypothetical protein C4297_04855 [Gemmataceae bacterium]